MNIHAVRASNSSLTLDSLVPSMFCPFENLAIFLSYVILRLSPYTFHNLIGSCIYRLFETHPDIQDVFTPFRGMTKEEMKHSSSLRAHALRVMSAVEKLLARINDMDKVEQLLYEMGQRHMMYDAKVDYIDVSTYHIKILSEY